VIVPFSRRSSRRPHDFETVANALEIFPFTETLLEPFEGLRVKFDHPPADGADHVVVVRVLRDLLVMRMLVRPLHLCDKSAFDEQRDGAVDRARETFDPFDLN